MLLALALTVSFALPQQTSIRQGQITFPINTTTSEGFRLTLTTHNPAKDHLVPVNADGHFHLAFPPDVNSGTLSGRGAHHFLPAANVYAADPRPIELTARPLLKNRFRIVDALDQPLEDVEVGWLGSNSLSHQYSETWQTVSPDKDGLYTISHPWPYFWVYARAKDRAMFARHLTVGDSEIRPLTLQGLARVSGSWQHPVLTLPRLMTVECDVPFRVAGQTEFTRTAFLKNGAFDLWVPAQTELELRCNSEFDSARIEIRPLEVGEHRILPPQEIDFRRWFSGRLVWPDGSPIQGALIQGLNRPYANAWQKEGQPDSGCMTDATGRFALLTGEEQDVANLAVVLFSADGQVLQRKHYYGVPRNALEMQIVFDLDSTAFSFQLELGPSPPIKALDCPPIKALDVHLSPLNLPEDLVSSVIECFEDPPTFLNDPPGLVAADAAIQRLWHVAFGEGEVLQYHFQVNKPGRVIRLDALPLGDWEITLLAEGYCPLRAEIKTPVEGDLTTFTLEPAGSLQLHYKRADGRPIPNRWVNLRYLSGEMHVTEPSANSQKGQTDEEGKLVLPIHRSGEYWLGGDLLDVLSLETGQVRVIDFQEPAQGSVWGRVNAMDPQVEYTVYLRYTEGLYPDLQAKLEGGEFFFPRVPVGEFLLEVRDLEGKVLEHQTKVRVEADRTSKVQL